jgi:hypothetical protein
MSELLYAKVVGWTIMLIGVGGVSWERSRS